MDQRNARKYWIVWVATSVIASSVLAAGLMIDKAHQHPAIAQVRSLFLPGKMTAGHHQIELACEACHTGPFSNRESMQQRCVGCHGGALTEADDKHPLSKFTDPHNAELISKLDARECVNCHVEHQPAMTHALGVTQPADFCVHCHQDVADDRPSHRNMPFDGCTASGCHNFHDDRALYEDFLIKHAAEPDQKKRAVLSATNFLEVAAQLPDYPAKRFPLRSLTLADSDAPTTLKGNKIAQDDWVASAHARAGVNCTACHNDTNQKAVAWNEHPTEEVCRSCHALEIDSFLSGKHGMRLHEQLAPMKPKDGWLQFKADAANRELGCMSCHSAHRFDVQFAAVEACEQCHNDEHTLAYSKSAHADLWRKELSGAGKKGSGVSCASCHLPRENHTYEEQDVRQTFVQHNQNETLQPNSKMIRPVCMNCHGLKFSIDALADRMLIRNNFASAPTKHIASIDMALADSKREHKKKSTDK